MIGKERPIRRYRDRPARVIQSNSVQLCITLDETAVTNAIRMMGWRVYVTNQPLEALSVEKAMVAYREEYLIERGFGRFKGFPLSLRPMYLQREDHIKGLIRLLSIGLRVLTLLEWKVRRRLTRIEDTTWKVNGEETSPIGFQRSLSELENSFKYPIFRGRN